MAEHQTLQGEKGGGKGGGGSSRTPVEADNTARSRAKARVLDLICEGPIRGLVDGLKSVYFDGTPLQAADGSYNFTNVKVHTRDGYPDQRYIKGFGGVEVENDVSTEVRHDEPVIRTVDNLDVDAVRVRLRFPNLSERDLKNGDLNGSSVKMRIDYRPQGDTWRLGVSDTITEKTVAPYERQYRVDLSDQGPWEIRVVRESEDEEKSNIQNQSYFAGYTEVTDSKLSYPDSALMAIEVDSKQFGSTVPSRAYDVYLRIVEVPSNYNPSTRAYTGIWDGTFKQAWTDNPAWCFRDLALSVRYGAGLENVSKWDLYRIARYCDELVDSGYGYKEPRFTFNAFFTKRENALKTLDAISSIFRGILFWTTNTTMPVADMPSDPVKIVSAANTIEDPEHGCFTRSSTGLKTRHTVVNVSWNDPEDGHRLVPERVEDRRGIEKFGIRQKDVTLVGCTSRGQARRAGLWMLYTEQNETQTISYSCSVDHATVRPGDLIQVSDSDLISARYSGRITGPGTSRLRLDILPDDRPSGQVWYLDVHMPNGTLQRRQVQQFLDQTGEIILDQPLSQPPVKGGMWLLSSAAIEPELYRVLSNEEQDDHIYRISAISHNPGKYAAVEEGLVLPDRETDLLPKGPLAPPLAIEVETYTYLAGGSEHQALVISWQPGEDPRTQSHIVEIMTPGNSVWESLPVQANNTATYEDATSGEYQVRVRAVDALGRTSPWKVRVTTIGSLLEAVPPDDVEIEAATFSVTLRPKNSSRPMQAYEYARAQAPLEGPAAIETNAVFLGQAPQLVDTGLEPGTLYFYWVRGVNVYGVSGWYPLQVTTLTDFDAQFDAIRDNIEEKGSLFPVLAGVANEQLEAIEGDLLPLRRQLRNANAGIASLQVDNEALKAKMLMLKASNETTMSTLNVEQTVRANVARQVTTLETGQAKVQDDLYTIYDPETEGFTAQAVRTVTVGDNKAILGLSADGEMSEIGAVADQFYVYNEISGEMVLAFVVEDGRVVMPEALIGQLNFKKLRADDGSLVFEDGKLSADYINADAIVVNNLESDNYQAGVSGYKFWPTGGELNSDVVFRGTVDFSQVLGTDGIINDIQDAQSTANSARSTANSARSTANSAKDTADSANSTANSAQNRISDWQRPGSTRIDGNKIFTGDAYVDTLQIKGNAVTVPSYNFWRGYDSVGTVSRNSGWHNTIYVDCDAEGAPVQILLSVEFALQTSNAQSVLGQNSVKFRLNCSDGTTIAEGGMGAAQNKNYYAVTTFTYAVAHRPSQGSKRYYVDIASDSRAYMTSIRRRFISVTGLKR